MRAKITATFWKFDLGVRVALIMDEIEKLRHQLTDEQRQRQIDLEEMWGPDNAVLILTQLPTARFCLTWSGWQAAGRTVRHGEHGARIASRTGEIITVFDLYQTTSLSV